MIAVSNRNIPRILPLPAPLHLCTPMALARYESEENGDQYVVQSSDEKDDYSQDRHDVPHPLHVRFFPVYITDRLYKSGITYHFLVFRRTIFLYQVIQPCIHHGFVCSGTKTDKCDPAIASPPGVVSPSTAPYGRQRNHCIRSDGGIFGYVGVCAFTVSSISLL